MTDKAERIAKVMAAAGLCSRRDAEKWITDGRVSLNGKKLTSPATTVTDKDKILVDGKPLQRQETIKMWLYHKPPGLVTTAKDPQGRETVFDALPRSMGRVISVGRLDLNSEGLLLLTNSGALSRHLELPSSGLPRVYHVRTYGHLDHEALADLSNGITVDGIKYKSIDVQVENPRSRALNNWLQVTLHEGKNREIRKVMEALDLQVNRLIRIGYGPFELDELPRGKVIPVSHVELRTFFKEIGFKE